jgi:hypothetical protein
MSFPWPVLRKAAAALVLVDAGMRLANTIRATRRNADLDAWIARNREEIMRAALRTMMREHDSMVDAVDDELNDEPVADPQLRDLAAKAFAEWTAGQERAYAIKPGHTPWVDLPPEADDVPGKIQIHDPEQRAWAADALAEIRAAQEAATGVHVGTRINGETGKPHRIMRARDGSRYIEPEPYSGPFGSNWDGSGPWGRVRPVGDKKPGRDA